MLNSVEQCVLYFYPKPTDYLPMINCLAEFLYLKDENDNITQICAQNTGLDYRAIQDCHEDQEMAWELQMESAKLTPSYHSYVPWVEIDGVVYNGHSSRSFTHAICKAYEEMAGVEPAACVWRERSKEGATVQMQNAALLKEKTLCLKYD